MKALARLAISLFTLANIIAAPAIDWPAVALVPLISGLDTPTTIAHAGDGSGRLFITEKVGCIRILLGTNLVAEPFLTITDRVHEEIEAPELGFLGLAFAPDFATSGWFYVNYTRVPDYATVVSRFRVSSTNANVALESTEQVLMVIPQPFKDHKGGCLAFGPDRMLYIATGDGGRGGGGPDSFNNAQNLGSPLGKILRIDVSGGTNGYAIPSDNPFRTNALARPEIWAFGLRNPWRFSFDHATGDLYISDVGNIVREEINFQPAASTGGENYGWRVMEETFPGVSTPGFNYSAVTMPIWGYGYLSDPPVAVIGGYVYRGTNHARMQGIYVFSDFGLPGIWGLKFDGTQWQRGTLFGGTNLYPTTFGEDEAGELYIASGSNGRVFKLVDSQACFPPVFAWTNTAHAPAVPVECQTPEARIHYTFAERDPLETDPWVSPGGIIPINLSQPVRARAYRSGLVPSQTVLATYTTFQAAIPRPTLVSISSNQVSILLRSDTPGASIYYTTNGSAPSTNASLYKTPFVVKDGTTIFAQAFRDGFTNSIPAAFHVTVRPTIRLNNGSLQITWPQAGLPHYAFQASADLKTWRTHVHRTTSGSGPVTHTYTSYQQNRHEFFRFIEITSEWPNRVP